MAVLNLSVLPKLGSIERHCSYIVPSMFLCYNFFKMDQGGDFMSTTMVRVRMDTVLKEQVDAALASMGLNMSTAVNAMARQIIHQGKLPFELYAASPAMREAIREAEEIRKHPEKYQAYENAHEMMEDILP